MNFKFFLFIKTILLSSVFVLPGFSQYVTIPDPSFVSWLQQNYPSCMNGNQMDTTCSGIVNASQVNISFSNVHNLDGIQYFDNCMMLTANHNTYLSQIPALPPNLALLNVAYDSLLSLPSLPSSLQQLRCENNELNTLPPLPNILSTLITGNNHIASLPALPPTLTQLSAAGNQLSIIPTLPQTLTLLYLDNNPLIYPLPSLPPNLSQLTLANTGLQNVPSLPGTITYLSINSNPFSVLPVLPAALTTLYCSNTNVTHLPPLPNGLTYLNTSQSPISSYSSLGNSLNNWNASGCQLTSLNGLPNTMFTLDCSNNSMLTQIDSLPTNLYYLYANNNPALTSLPPVPQSLKHLDVRYSNISCLPQLPNVMYTLDIGNSPINCLPNYPQQVVLDVTTPPLCMPGNTNNCPGYFDVAGRVMTDQNNDCQYQPGEPLASSYPVQLFDASGNLLSTFVSNYGGYSFSPGTGNYYVKTISNYLHTTACPDSIPFTVPPTTVIQDFDVRCNGNNFDVAAQNMVPRNWVFPGITHILLARISELSAYFGVPCTTGISGQAQLQINGQAQITGASILGIPPVSFTAQTAQFQFSNLSASTTFAVSVLCDTTIQAGDSICATLTIATINGELDTINNTLHFCYAAMNSYDPNMKEVYPTGSVQYPYNEPFTYTVHFQNTGNAPAFNIKLIDTLDANLDVNTFKVLGSSHPMNAIQNGPNLRFEFPNILLADSTSDEPNSHGWVQYRIKPLNNLPIGTHLENTAYIYFDYNPPIVTNTTVNTYTLNTTSLPENTHLPISVFPNPATETIQLILPTGMDKNGTVEILNLLGETVKTISSYTSGSLFIGDLNPGVYFISYTTPAQKSTARFIKG